MCEMSVYPLKAGISDVSCLLPLVALQLQLETLDLSSTRVSDVSCLHLPELTIRGISLAGY